MTPLLGAKASQHMGLIEVHAENFIQVTAFIRIKEMATTAPLLRYYNPAEELTIQCDASEKGLGATFPQKAQPVAFAS